MGRMKRIIVVGVILAAFFAWYLRPLQVVDSAGCAHKIPVPGVVAKARIAWKLGELVHGLTKPIPEEKVRAAVNGTGQVLGYWWQSFMLAAKGLTDTQLLHDEDELKKRQAERDARCAPIVPGFGGYFGGSMTVGTWNVEYGSSPTKIVPMLTDMFAKAAVIGTQEMSPGMRAAARRIPNVAWTEGNAVPIGWRTDLFTLVGSGRESALRNASVEGNNLTKQITWVILKDKSGQTYAIVNTHLPYNVESRGHLQVGSKPRRIAAYLDQLAIFVGKMTELKRYGFVAGTCDCNADYTRVTKAADQNSPLIYMAKHGFFPQQHWLGARPTQASGSRSIDYAFSNQTPASWVTLLSQPSDHKRVLVGYGQPAVETKVTA